MVWKSRILVLLLYVVLGGGCRTQRSASAPETQDPVLQQKSASLGMDPDYLKLADDVLSASETLQASGSCDNPTDETTKLACISAHNFAQAGETTTALGLEDTKIRQEANQALTNKIIELKSTALNLDSQQIAGYALMVIGGALVTAGGLTFVLNQRKKDQVSTGATTDQPAAKSARSEEESQKMKSSAVDTKTSSLGTKARYASPFIAIAGAMLATLGTGVAFGLSADPTSPANVYITTLANISVQLDQVDKATGQGL